MKRLIKKVVSRNMWYFIDEVKIGGRVLYAIMESIGSSCGRFREYDLNMYYSSLDDAIEKLESL